MAHEKHKHVGRQVKKAKDFRHAQHMAEQMIGELTASQAQGIKIRKTDSVARMRGKSAHKGRMTTRRETKQYTELECDYTREIECKSPVKMVINKEK